jgi:hypothetical protein
MAPHPEVLSYLVEGARRRGIDPNLVVKAFNHEGLSVFDPNKPDRGGDEGSSFGPFQLHYGGMSKSMPRPGMGDDFTRATGLDARDPSTWRAQTDYVLDHLAHGGSWSPWMGAKAEGITGRMGLPGGSHAPSVASPQAATDAAGPNQQPAPAAPGATTQMPAPGMPGGAMGPPNPPGWTPPMAPRDQIAAAKAGMPAPQQQQPSTWQDMVSKMASGFGKGMGGANIDASIPNRPVAQTYMTSLGASPMFDPNAIAAQRDQLAQALARLNSGKLYG